MQTTKLAFRILYNTLYYLLYLVLLGVLIVSPADLMRQAVQHNNNTNILIIAASYLVTILVLLFIYAARLYINRSVLASIPKSWIPVEKSDGVPRRVREVISRDLSRSAAVAWVARPRFEGPTTSRLGTGAVAVAVGVGGSRGEDGVGGVGKEKNGKGLSIGVEQPPRSEKRVQRMISRLSCTGGGGEEKNIAREGVVAVPLGDPESPPVWGEIEHPGWASPTSPDLPNLQYNAVISELPNLIEAKALTLAPRDPESRTEPPTLDPDAVAVLQRPETMGVREYLVHLTEIEVLAPEVVGPFISMYEMARFSTRPITNQQFRELMHLFAEVLRGMQPLDPAVLLEEYDDDEDEDGENDYRSAIYDTDIDNDAPQGTSSSSGGEDGGSIHGPTTTTVNDNNNTKEDDENRRRSRQSTRLRDPNNNSETYTTNDSSLLNNNNNNFNNINLLTRLPSSSSGNSKSSISSSNASLSSQRRYSNRKSLQVAGISSTTPGRNTPSSMMMRNSSANTNTWQRNSNSHSQQFRTAPTTPKSRRTVLTARSGGSSSRRSSSSTSTSRSRTGQSHRSRSFHSGVSGEMDSFAQTRRPFVVGGSSEGEGEGNAEGDGDGSSMRSVGSGESSGGGSVVIRLANGDEESVHGLPYILGMGMGTEMGRSPGVGT